MLVTDFMLFLRGGNNRFSDAIRTTILLFLLIIFYQVFYYIKDFSIIYYFSKIFAPVIVLFITLFFMIAYSKQIKIGRDGVLVLVAGSYLILVSALTAYFNYGQSLHIGVAWQIKVLPLFFFFSVNLMLQANWVNVGHFYRATTLLSVLALFSYLILYIAINPADYWHDDSYFFVNDSKGFRFRFPDVPVLLGLFIFFWRWQLLGRLLDALVWGVFLGYFVFIHEQRFLLLCVIMLTSYRIFKNSGVLLKAIVIGVIPIIVMLVFSLDIFISLLSGNDSSLLARLLTINNIFNTVSESPLGLMFGYGNLSPEFNGGFEALYGRHFWLSDVGWLGLLYEYGLIGVFLIFYILYKIIRYSERLVILREPFLLALRDLGWIILLMSIIAPRVIYASGVSATIFAILAFTYHTLKKYNTVHIEPMVVMKGENKVVK